MSAPVQQPTHIAGQCVPHIVKSILEQMLRDAPLSIRPVCKHWRELADRKLAQHLALDLALPPNEPQLDLNIENEEDMPPNQTYVWELSAAKLPLRYLCWPLAHPMESVPDPARAIDIKPWVDIKKETRMIDVRNPVEFVGGRVSLDMFNGLDTVRFQQEKYRSAGFEAYHLLPHVRRVIFSDGPYGTARAHRIPHGLPDIDCPNIRQGSECNRQHTSKLVLNCRTPVFAHGVGNRIQSGLEELVIIFHGWGIIPRYNREHPEGTGGRLCDPRSDVRPLVFLALGVGARVLIVNAEMVDFKRGRCLSNVGNDVEAWREALIAEAVDAHGLSAEQIGRLEHLSIEQYKERVGEEEWAVETMTDL